MTADPRFPDDLPPSADSGVPRPLAAEPSIAAGSVLGRIYQSLADFTVLTRRLRGAVDEGLAPHLVVTGWQDGVLRVVLERPALATRWRFQEPGVRRALARDPRLAGLREIRLVTTALRIPSPVADRQDMASLRAAPVDALRDLASQETHAALRDALLRLGDAAEKARRQPRNG